MSFVARYANSRAGLRTSRRVGRDCYRLALALIVITSCSAQTVEESQIDSLGQSVEETLESTLEPTTTSTQEDSVETESTSSSLFPVVRNDVSIAEAAASFGCMGYNLTAPINLKQFDDDVLTFDKLFSPYARPWLVKIEEAGVASGRLVRPKGADEEFLQDQLREYDTPSQAFTTATFLDSRWSVLSSIWRESLSYGLSQFNSGLDHVDAAYESLRAYSAALTSACKQAVEGSIKSAINSGLPFSSYIYIQLAEYLIDWHPKWFTRASLTTFEGQFSILDR